MRALIQLKQEKGFKDKERKPDLQLRLSENKGVDEENNPEINTILSLSLKET